MVFCETAQLRCAVEPTYMDSRVHVTLLCLNEFHFNEDAVFLRLESKSSFSEDVTQQDAGSEDVTQQDAGLDSKSS